MAEKVQAGQFKEVLEREIKTLQRPDQREAAGDLVKRMDEIHTLMPPNMAQQAGRLLLRAVIYCRDKLTKPVRPESFVRAVLEAAEFGLAIDGRLAHAIPFTEGDGATLHFIPDYKGMVAVAKWRAVVKDCYARVVREKDSFRVWEDENGSHFNYEIYLKGERGRPFGAFCVLVFPDDRRRCEFMPEDEILSVRARSRSSAWKTDEDEMRKKSAIRRALKLCQDDPMVSDLLAADNKAYDLDGGVIEMPPLDLDKDTAVVAAPERESQRTENGPPPRRSRRRRSPGAPPPAQESFLDENQPASPAIVDTYQRGWKALYEEGEDPVESLGWTLDEAKELSIKAARERIAVFAEKVKAMRRQRNAEETPAP